MSGPGRAQRPAGRLAALSDSLRDKLAAAAAGGRAGECGRLWAGAAALVARSLVYFDVHQA